MKKPHKHIYEIFDMGYGIIVKRCKKCGLINGKSLIASHVA